MHPPKLAERFLFSFLRNDLAEDVAGDLEEKFHLTAKKKSLLRAKFNYWYQVINYIRPFAIRKVKSSPVNNYAMLENYIKIGWRNLLRNKGYSAINIGGLAVGIAVAMMIGLWVSAELTYDTDNRGYDRVAQVLQRQTINGTIGTQTAIPIPLAPELQKSYGSDFEYLAMSSWTGDHILTYGDNKFSKKGNYMDVSAPYIMDLKMIHGTLDGLKEPGSIMLSQSVASALFGDGEAMDQLMKIDNKLDVKVTGVYEDMPYNSQFRDVTFLAPWQLYVSSEPWIKRAQEQVQWGNNSFQLFAKISEKADMGIVSEKIKNAKLDNVDADDKKYNAQIFLHPMKDWHLNSSWKNGIQTGGLIQYVWMFGVVGIFVLLLACINFMNLSTARSEQRAKEVGIRKSIGSLRMQLINQFMSESFLVVILSFCIANLLVLLTLPAFNQLTDKKITIPFDRPEFWLLSVSFILITGFLSGSYPALYLSSFQPVKVLKGTFRVGRFASMPRKVLVVVQFTISVSMVIGTIIVYNQVQYSKNRNVGFENDKIIMVQMKTPDFYGKYDLLRTEMKNTGHVEEMAESSSPLTGIWSNNGGFRWEGKDPAQDGEFGTVWVTYDFGKSIRWQIKEGRDFSRDFISDSTGIVINEAAVRFTNMTDPIGKIIHWGDENGDDLKIIGVVKDMLMESPFRAVKPTIFLNASDRNANWIVIRLSDEKPIRESLSHVEGVFKKILPMVPFDFQFANEAHARKFASEERIGRLSGIFAVLAIFISCLGLFGLASFVAEQRTKEIGIRKVLGASVGNLWTMLSKDFVALILLSSFIAVPIAYYTLTKWLTGYEYRIEITWWTFAIACIGSVIITILTVSYQAIKAAVMSPVKSLKSE